MPAKDNFSAYVRVDGSCLPEYNVEVLDDGQTITCWIPSEAGKVFDLCVHNTLRTETPLAVRTCVDGVKKPLCNNLSNVQTQEIGPKLPNITVGGFENSMSSMQPFTFSPCILQEGETGTVPISKKMGQIELILCEVTYGSRRVPDSFALVKIPPLHISERAKKGIVHGIQLGKETAIPKFDTLVDARYVKQVLKFVFKYRPIDVLRANEIAPLKPKTQLQGQEDIIDLTLEEEDEQEDEQDQKIRQLQVQLEALQRQKKEKKRKRNLSDAGIKREVKVEIDLS